MNTPLLTWLFIIGVVAIIFAIDAMSSYRKKHRHRAHAHHVIDSGSEREILFIPGDPLPRKTDKYEYEDLEDF